MVAATGAWSAIHPVIKALSNMVVFVFAVVGMAFIAVKSSRDVAFHQKGYWVDMEFF